MIERLTKWVTVINLTGIIVVCFACVVMICMFFAELFGQAETLGMMFIVSVAFGIAYVVVEDRKRAKP